MDIYERAEQAFRDNKLYQFMVAEGRDLSKEELIHIVKEMDIALKGMKIYENVQDVYIRIADELESER